MNKRKFDRLHGSRNGAISLSEEAPEEAQEEALEEALEEAPFEQMFRARTLDYADCQFEHPRAFLPSVHRIPI